MLNQSGIFDKMNWLLVAKRLFYIVIQLVLFQFLPEAEGTWHVIFVLTGGTVGINVVDIVQKVSKGKLYQSQNSQCYIKVEISNI